MLKCLVIFGVLFGFVGGAWSQVPRNGSQQNQPAQSKQDNANPIQPPSTAIEVQTSSAKHASEPDKEPSKYPWRKLYGPANIPTWFLVGVGFWAGLMALRTLKSINRQALLMEGQLKEMQAGSAVAKESADAARVTAKATAIAAVAAETSAKAAMGVAVPTLAVYKFSFVVPEGWDREQFYRKPQVRLELKNYGQSPAFLKEFSVSFSWGTGRSDSGGYSFEPERVVDAGATFTFGPLELEILNGPSTKDEIWSLVAGSQILVFTGWVTYKDVFGSPRRKLEFEKHLVEFDLDPAKMMIVDSQLIRNQFGDPEKD